MACVKLLLDMVAAQWPPLPTRVAACFSRAPSCCAPHVHLPQSFVPASSSAASSAVQQTGGCLQTNSVTDALCCSSSSAELRCCRCKCCCRVAAAVVAVAALRPSRRPQHVRSALAFSPHLFLSSFVKEERWISIGFFFFGINLKTHKTTNVSLHLARSLVIRSGFSPCNKFFLIKF